MSATPFYQPEVQILAPPILGHKVLYSLSTAFKTRANASYPESALTVPPIRTPLASSPAGRRPASTFLSLVAAQDSARPALMCVSSDAKVVHLIYRTVVPWIEAGIVGCLIDLNPGCSGNSPVRPAPRSYRKGRFKNEQAILSSGDFLRQAYGRSEVPVLAHDDRDIV